MGVHGCLVLACLYATTLSSATSLVSVSREFLKFQDMTLTLPATSSPVTVWANFDLYFWCNINLFSMAQLFILSSVAGFWNYDFVGGSYSRGSYEKQGLYQCPQCDKRFESPKSLSNHQAVHDGKTTCNICGKVESTRSNLNRHVKITHPETCVL